MSFVIWNLTNGIATHLSGARNDNKGGAYNDKWSVIARVPRLSLRGAEGDEAISCIMSWVTKQYYVYIMTNVRNTVLYVGITNDLIRRIYEHKEKLVSGFTKKYNIVKLVYYEVFEDIENAILREKQLKGGSRQKKVELVNSTNREWRDLYDEL